MQFRAYFKHMPTSMATYAYAEQKIGKQIDKHSLRVLEAHVTFWVEHNEFRVSCHIVADGGIDLAITAQDPISMNAAIDNLEEKIEGAIRRAKGKLRRYLLRPIETAREAPGDLPADAIDAADIVKLERAKQRRGMRLVPAPR